MDTTKEKNKAGKKSPLKGKLPRHAGQSVQQKIDDLVDVDLLPWLAVGAAFLLITIYEWIKYLSSTPPKPFLITILSAIIISFCTYKFVHARKKLTNLKLGRDGEKKVGQHLENLREHGCVIFHDIVADNFNLDHVIISEKGIFVVETKTLRKRGNAKIIYDGTDIIADGFKMTPNPVEQAQASARWLRNILKESTGKNFPVKPVVVFPGWFVEFIGGLNPNNTWVLNPKALPSFIRREPSTIPPADKHLVVYHLSRHMKIS